MAAIKQDLQAKGFPEDTTVTMTGPGITKAMVKKIQDESNARRTERGCIQFGKLDDGRAGPARPARAVRGPSDALPLSPGYSVIMDTEITSQSNHNAQSVILTAPTIGNNQTVSSSLN